MKNLAPYIVIVILLMISLHQCERIDYEEKRADNTEKFLKDSIRYHIDKNGKEIVSKTALNSNLKLLLSKQIDSTGQLKSLVSYYKNVVAAGNINTVTKIDTIEIGYEVPVPCDFNREWSKDDNFYTISGNSNKNGITINSLEIPNTLSFVIGDKKKRFLSTEYEVSVVNSNPFVKTTGLDTYALKVPQKRFGIGLMVGYGATKDGISPFVGLGASYNFIRF